MRNNLRNARRAAGYSASTLADLVCTSVRNYYFIEAGKHNSKPDIWERLEKILNIPQEVLRENVEG